jgi:hypothetical protein
MPYSAEQVAQTLRSAFAGHAVDDSFLVALARMSRLNPRVTPVRRMLSLAPGLPFHPLLPSREWISRLRRRFRDVACGDRPRRLTRNAPPLE